MFGLFRKPTAAPGPIVVPTKEQNRVRSEGLAKAMSEDYIRLVMGGKQIDDLCEALRSAGDLVVHAYLANSMFASAAFALTRPGDFQLNKRDASGRRALAIACDVGAPDALVEALRKAGAKP